MAVDDEYSVQAKSLCRGIFVVISRFAWIFRITTTNQEVAGSSPAGPAIVFNDLRFPGRPVREQS
jgi:hypothetical protein